MEYTAEISRANPSCFLFLIDRSGSMSDPFGGGIGGRQKADGVATLVNKLLQDLVGRCSKPELRDYFEVGVIGYGERVGPAFGGELSDRELVWISEVAKNPIRIESRMAREVDDTGRTIEVPEDFYVWFDPEAKGGTPMRQAMRKAYTIIQDWVSRHPKSYPATVVNITDAESTEGDPTPEADALRSLGTSDGKVLLYNAHISSRPGSEILLPDSESILPDDFARLLFRISSTLPTGQREFAKIKGYAVGDQSRGFTFNATQVGLADLLEIGTRTVDLR